MDVFSFSLQENVRSPLSAHRNYIAYRDTTRYFAMQDKCSQRPDPLKHEKYIAHPRNSEIYCTTWELVINYSHDCRFDERIRTTRQTAPSRARPEPRNVRGETWRIKALAHRFRERQGPQPRFRHNLEGIAPARTLPRRAAERAHRPTRRRIRRRQG